MMAWFGGSYEGAEDVAIWTATRGPGGAWTPPTQAAKVHRAASYNGKDPAPLGAGL
jgi:predicted neuraminidase